VGEDRQVIPRNLHFIFGLTPDFGGKPFSFCHWAAIRSAQMANPEWKTCFWCIHEPSGRYFDAIKRHVDIRHVDPIDKAFGNPIPHPAHKCDWLRLQVLNEHGGVYLDLDTITVKGFDGWLDEPPGSMVVETVGDQTIGLCNALIAAEPGAAFLQRWIEKFRGFRSTGHDRLWNESAVKWPYQVWLENPDFHTFRSATFLKPDWTEIPQLFQESHEFPLAIGHHLWESFAWPYLKQITPESYKAIDCTYTKLLERHLGDEIRSSFF